MSSSLSFYQSLPLFFLLIISFFFVFFFLLSKFLSFFIFSFLFSSLLHPPQLYTLSICISTSFLSFPLWSIISHFFSLCLYSLTLLFFLYLLSFSTPPALKLFLNIYFYFHSFKSLYILNPLFKKNISPLSLLCAFPFHPPSLFVLLPFPTSYIWPL